MNPAGRRPGDEPDIRDVRDRRVLIVDDDETVAEVVSEYLLAGGFVVDVATDGFRALASIERSVPDLIVLDRMLPGIDGVEVCRRIRAHSSVPIIMLTALGDEQQRIAGLEAGADDYLTKPFSPRELVLRVTSLLRRSLTDLTPQGAIELGPFAIDPAARTATMDARLLVLTAREFDLLLFLLRRPNQVFSREELLRAVWGWTHGDLSTVTVHVRRLREKIEADPRHPQTIATVWGVGYRLAYTEEVSAVRL